MTLTDDSLLRRNPEMVFSNMDDEIVLMSVENSEYYGLDPVGSRIWELLVNSKKFSELITVLLEEYDVSPEECRRDMTAFLIDLAEKKIILIE
jgi:hypothetical protein